MHVKSAPLAASLAPTKTLARHAQIPTCSLTIFALRSAHLAITKHSAHARNATTTAISVYRQLNAKYARSVITGGMADAYFAVQMEHMRMNFYSNAKSVQMDAVTVTQIQSVMVATWTYFSTLGHVSLNAPQATSISKGSTYARSVIPSAASAPPTLTTAPPAISVSLFLISSAIASAHKITI